jgi:hypothetical protein
MFEIRKSEHEPSTDATKKLFFEDSNAWYYDI